MPVQVLEGISSDLWVDLYYSIAYWAKRPN